MATTSRGYGGKQHKRAEFVVSDLTHNRVIDQLGEIYSTTEISSIPTGWATFDLVDQKLSIFLLITGALTWLNGLYGVNLRTNDFDTGFNTDLHSIAESIMDLHDPDYTNNLAITVRYSRVDL